MSSQVSDEKVMQQLERIHEVHVEKGWTGISGKRVPLSLLHVHFLPLFSPANFRPALMLKSQECSPNFSKFRRDCFWSFWKRFIYHWHMIIKKFIYCFKNDKDSINIFSWLSFSAEQQQLKQLVRVVVAFFDVSGKEFAAQSTISQDFPRACKRS